MFAALHYNAVIVGQHGDLLIATVAAPSGSGPDEITARDCCSRIRSKRGR